MAFDPDAYLAEAPASESSIKSKFDPDAFVADTVDEHKIDPNFNPLATALAAGEGTPEWEHARKVDEAREAMSSSDKKKYGLEDSFGGKAVNAVKGAVQFGVGLAAAPALNAASIAANTPSIIKGTSNALLGTNFDDTRSPVAQQLQTDAVLAAEKAGQSVQPEQGSTPTKSYLISRTMDHPLTAQEIADLKAGKLKKEIEQLPNQSFKDRVEDFRRNSELSQGKVQDVGIFADVAKKSGFTPSEATLTPEQKKELGVEPDAVENYIIDAAGTAENPENAVYALAPEIPGVAGALKGTGKAISAVASPLAKAAELLPEGSLHSMVAHPVRTALASTLRGGLKLAPKAGEFVQSAGELASGGAPAEGASAFGIRAKQALIGSVGGTAIGVVTDPEDPVQGALSGFVMGAGGGALHSAKGAQLAGKRAAMEEQGAALRTGNDSVDAKHDIIMGNFDPEAAKAINRQRAALAADGTHLVVTDQAGFNAAMQANGMPDANGVRGATLGDDKHIVTQGQDGSRTIYINADAVGGEKGFQGVDTAGHEIGHAVVDYLKAQSSQAAASTLVDAVANSLTDAEKADIAAKYSKAINAQTAGASVNPTEETIAEITRKVLAKQDISEFGMPKTLGTKISNAISDFFTGARGDSAGMLWGTPEITKAKRLIQDALYDQGKRSTEMRQRARDVAEGKVEPNVTERQQQITARLAEIAALDPKKVTPSILKERGQLVKEASDLTADEAARTGQPAPGATPAPAPAQPAAPAGPSANDRLTVKTALVTMGYPARVADQMAAAAQGGTIEELIKDALAKKQPTPVPQTAPPAAPAPNVPPSGPSPAVLQPKPIAATPTGQLSTFEAPAATATAEAPAQLSTFDPNATNQVSAGVPPLSPGNINAGPTPTEPAGGSRPVSTPEEVGAAVGAATDAAKATPEYERALKKKEKAKAAGDAATEAQADARLETLEREARLDALKKLLPRHEEGSGTAPDELHVSADNFGNESVRGKVDENNPVHREIMAHGEMSPEEIARVKQLQDNAGAISYIDYGSAEKEANARRHGEQRRAELAASPAQERVEGVGGITEQKNKAVIPVGNTVTASGRVNTVALSPDKILSNLGSVVRAATENGLPNGGFSGRPEALQNLSIYLRNHRNGFSGDGTVKVDPTIAPNATGESFVDANGQPVDPETAKARMRVFNMAMHDTRATAPARAEAKRLAYEAAMKAWTDGGEQGPKPRKPRDLDPKSKFQAEEGQALAKRFGEMDEATGETNPLRSDLEAAGYDASKELESPWENLRPELIRDIRDSADGKQEIVRPHRVAPEDIEGAVTNPPSGKATLAGFMPGEETAHPSDTEMKRMRAMDLARYASEVLGMPEGDVWHQQGGPINKSRLIDNIREYREANPSFREWGNNQASFMPGEGEPSIKSKVEEAAKKQGYTISAAHSTNAGPFTVFKTDNLSAHFGTPKAAEDRAQQLRDFSINTVGREHADARVMPLFLKVENPLRLPDLASVTETERGEIKPLAEAREEWLSKLSKEDREAWENPDDYEGNVQDEILNEYGAYPYPMAWESQTDFPTILRDKGVISNDEFWDVQYDPQAAVELLKEKGYDGIEYVNDVEDPGSVSHIVFDPSQVKSAEDFTKDDTGADIPISKRFDASNPDIRFMPGGDLADFKPKQDELGFYSRLRSHVDEAALGTSKPKPAQQWLGVIDKWAKGAATPTLGVEGRGIARDELEMSGIREWLKDHGGKPLSKAEVLDFIDKGGVQVKEVQKRSGFTDEQKDRFNELVNERAQQIHDGRVDNEIERQVDNGADEDNIDRTDISNDLDWDTSWDRAQREVADEQGFDIDKEGDETKYSNYQLPGGENYKEVLLTLPTKSKGWQFKELENGWVEVTDGTTKRRMPNMDAAKAWADTQGASERTGEAAGDFRSSHWDEPNVLAHLRQADHIDTENKEVRLIEEIQSDLHQEGRKSGYKDSVSEEQLKQAESAMLKAEERMTSGPSEGKDSGDNYAAYREARKEYNRLYAIKEGNAGVPNAPFKKTWAELAFKRALRMAVEDGKDKIAWTPGKYQIDRYEEDFRKNVDEIKWTDHGDTHEVVAWKDGKPIFNAEFNQSGKSTHPIKGEPRELSEVVGQNIADQILKGEGNAKGVNEASWKGDDLSIGGEGMKGFYDKILPDFVRKYVAKWGGKVGTTELSNGKQESRIEGRKPGGEWSNGGSFTDPKEGEKWLAHRRENYPNAEWRIVHDVEPGDTVHSVEITPEMRDAVMGGQPMFMPGGGEGQSNLTADVEKNIRDAKMMAPKDPAGFLRKMADSARAQGKEDAAVNFEKAITALGKPGGDLSDFKPEDQTAEPSIKSKGDLASFMPGDFSGRNEVNAKEGSEETDFSPAAMKKRRIGDFMTQKPWLDAEAQKLGYDDADALNDADNAKFNELAEKWREDHPRYDSQGRMLFMPGEGQPGK